MPTPTVTVVIPAYNAAPWIAETVESVLNQSFHDFEIIVVDDGSMDQTAKVVDQYNQKCIYIQKNNGGAASARNVGIRSARGTYIAFIDADDLWGSLKLERQMNLIATSPGLSWVYSDAVRFDEITRQELYRFSRGARMYHGDILCPLLLHDFIPSPTPLIKSAVFDDVGLFDESPEMRAVEDWDMWLRIAEKYQAGFIPQPLASYRVHRTSTTGEMDLQVRLKNLLTVVNKTVERNPERLASLRKQALSNVHLSIGQSYAQRRHRYEARQMFAQSLYLSPSQFRAWMYWGASFLPTSVLTLSAGCRRFLRRLR